MIGLDGVLGDYRGLGGAAHQQGLELRQFGADFADQVQPGDVANVVICNQHNRGVIGGQQFIPSTLPKLAKVRELIKASGRNIRLEVDGGVTLGNIGEIAKAGADMFVAGSAIFGSKDYAATIAAMRKELAAV